MTCKQCHRKTRGRNSNDGLCQRCKAEKIINARPLPDDGKPVDYAKPPTAPTPIPEANDADKV